MKRRIFLLLLVVSLAGAAGAQEKGTWRAASKTAESITGDVTFGDDRVTINFASFPLAEIRSLTPAEAAAVFNADGGTPGLGHLYRVIIPAAKKFLHKNTLCGSEETEWMVTYVSNRTLQVGLFSGQKMPVMTPEALSNSTSLCGTFSYVP
jgi:hypothetical protein